MCFCSKKGCIWNGYNANIFHSEWSKHPGTFYLPVTHGYWHKPGKTPNGQKYGANNGGSTSGSGGRNN